MFRIGIDVGGTFTDFMAHDTDSTNILHKESSTPSDPSVGVMAGLGEIARRLSLTVEAFLAQTSIIVHGTTVATNAILTQQGARTGLLTTSGLRDALEMRGGIREEPFNNRFQPPPPLAPRALRLGVRERIDTRGRILDSIHLEDVLASAQQFQRAGVSAIAICFMHSHANPEHEQKAAAALQEALGHVYITASSDLLPQIGFYDRVSTTVMNAYIGPTLRTYLERLTKRLSSNGFSGVLLIMQSNGGVATPELVMNRAVSTVLSGPAAAPVAGLQFARRHDRADCITVDMGGTSFDAVLVQHGTPLLTTEGSLGGRRIAEPMLDIHTIGAGGGSIGWIDAGGMLRMGPQSAGALPGPACYDRGGAQPTCTDANLVLGYLSADEPLSGGIRLDSAKARHAIQEYVADPLGLSVEEAAAAMYDVINVNMAAGIQEVTVKRGVDPRDFLLVVAGGAGPVHAGMVALELGIETIVIPRESSVFCAVGMLISNFQHDFVRAFPAAVASMNLEALRSDLQEMSATGERMLETEGVLEADIRVEHSADMRYVGQFFDVNVPMDDAIDQDGYREALVERFHAIHDRLYGYALADAAAEIVNLRTKVVGRTQGLTFQQQPASGPDPARARKGARPVYLPARRKVDAVAVFSGEDLSHGNQLPGPAIVELPTTTIFVPAEYRLTCDAYGSFVLQLAHRPQEAPVKK